MIKSSIMVDKGMDTDTELQKYLNYIIVDETYRYNTYLNEPSYRAMLKKVMDNFCKELETRPGFAKCDARVYLDDSEHFLKVNITMNKKITDGTYTLMYSEKNGYIIEPEL